MIGKDLGPYRLMSELGSGGMGTVFLAEVMGEAPGVERGARVAIKVVHPHLLSTPGFFKRFLREAELGRQVQHENVVRTFDVDATLLDDKQVNYMAMEYVEGRSLRELLNDLGSVPEALLREIALQTAAGLAAIHENDIVHRDLKPENVLITNDQRVRIMDLGVAKLQEASIAITREGQFAGSVLYAAPEQLNEAEVGPLSDLYSVGVMLQELATGQNPFRRDDAGAVIKAHLTLVPPRVNDQSPEFSSFLSEVTATLLAKKASERFDSAQALWEVLSESEESAWWAERERKLHAREKHLPKIQVRRETELCGRENELKALREAWQKANEGHGNTLFLEGEAGIGKTRLVDHFVRSLQDEDVHVLYGSYPPSGGMGGLSDAILGKFGASGLDETLRTYLTVTPSLIPAFVALVKHESTPTGTDPLQGDALQAVCCHLVQALAAEKPTLWVVDDAHFAPGASRDLALALARAIGPHRALLLITSRPGLPEDELTHFSRLENFARVPVGRLSPREVIEVLRDSFKSELLAEKLGGKIAYKSDGIPFFVFEMIRGLKEGRFLKETADGTYVETQQITDIEVPSAVKDLIEGRLRDVSKVERALLDIGAVQGFEFDPDLLARVMERKKFDVLQDLAAMERRSGIVRAEGRRYRFDHNQVQEVLYGSLSEGLKEESHALLAEAMEKREDVADEELDEVPGEIAFFLASHHMHGSRPREGKRYLARALDYLGNSYQNEAALELADRALTIERLLKDEDRVEVLLRKQSRLDLVGRRDEERATLDEAVAIADKTSDPALRSKAHRVLGWHFRRISKYDDALATLSNALGFATEAGDRALEAEAKQSLGVLLNIMNRYEEARSHYEDALGLFRETGDRKGEATASTNIGTGFWYQGRYDEARERFEATLAFALESGDRAAEMRASGNLGDTLEKAGRFKEARTYHEACLAVARESGDRVWETIGLLNLGFVRLAVGDSTAARSFIGRGRMLSAEIGDRRVESYAIFHTGEVAEQVGNREEAERHYEDALVLRREIGYRAGLADSLARVGKLKAAAGRDEEAIAALDEALALSREVSHPGSLVVAAAYRALLREGDVSGAVDTFAEHEARASHLEKIEVRFVLWRATQDPAHLEEAHRLLEFLREHAPEEDRAAMVENVVLYRDIEAAWKEHGS